MTPTTSPPVRPLAPQQLAWLRAELPQWTAQGLITEDQAASISVRYDTGRHARSSLGRLLLLLGGAFVGVGLIWLVAANLDQLSPVARFAVVAALWLSFLVGGEALASRGASPALVGALRLLAALGSGAVVMQAAQSMQVPAFEPRLVGLWAAGALLHGYLARAHAPFLVGVATGVTWWFAQPLWAADSGTSVVLLLGTGAVVASALAVLHDPRLPGFAWTWRTVASGMALLAVFVAAVPDVGRDSIVWTPWLGVALAAAALSLVTALLVRRDRDALEPAVAVLVAAVALALSLWTTGADPAAVRTADWLHAAVSVLVYVLLAVGLVALGTVRDHPALTWLATGGLVVFTTFQSFAVFAPIVTGAWLFVVLGTVFLGSGYLFDSARRELVHALDGGPGDAAENGAER